MMDNIINLFINNVFTVLGIIVLSISEIFIWSKFYNEKIKFKNYSLYIAITIMCIIGLVNYSFVNAFLKVVIMTLVMCLCNFLIFKKKIRESIISTIYGQFLLAFAETFFAIIWLVIFGKDTDFIKNNLFGTFISDFFISLNLILIYHIPFIRKIYVKIVNFTYKIKFKSLIYICLLLIISINFLGAIIFYNMKPIYIIIINSLLLLIYSFIIYKAMNERNDNVIMKAENKSLMQSLNEYENMVDRQRVNNHENKNQLLIIKNMIKKKDKDVVKYIDTIVNDEKEDDEALYTKVKTIPTGGLQGIIYQKMLTMKDEKILFSLDVSRDVRKIDMSNLSIEDNYKLCKIIGVFLDNAIEESRKLDEKIIMISLYVDEEMFVIDIANRFKNKIDVEKVDEKGYTTKGNGHGYGLSLVKQIIDESNGKFINNRKITEDVFKQSIKIKI